ncbi:hypothetical protein ACH5RR_040162 [Cinchona calisaya]|uniref:Ultraviolet-B-repressible protein n=1 Tax=Cinchona calisaya TaxID=153742 RepID=A0ABD2XU65_9GENT
MASVSVSMAMPITRASQKKLQQPATSKAANLLINNSSKNIQIQGSYNLKEKAIAGLTAAALTASMVVPEVAQAASSDFSPSLKNFLLSIFAGGAVLTALFGAVIGVSNFDPVKRS